MLAAVTGLAYSLATLLKVGAGEHGGGSQLTPAPWLARPQLAWPQARLAWVGLCAACSVDLGRRVPASHRPTTPLPPAARPSHASHQTQSVLLRPLIRIYRAGSVPLHSISEQVQAYLGYFLPLPVIMSALRSGAAAGVKTATTAFMLLFSELELILNAKSG